MTTLIHRDAIYLSAILCLMLVLGCDADIYSNCAIPIGGILNFAMRGGRVEKLRVINSSVLAHDNANGPIGKLVWQNIC